jgi:hypothetical protein
MGIPSINLQRNGWGQWWRYNVSADFLRTGRAAELYTTFTATPVKQDDRWESLQSISCEPDGTGEYMECLRRLPANRTGGGIVYNVHHLMPPNRVDGG